MYTNIHTYTYMNTLTGRQQAREAGLKLARIVGDKPMYVFVSPYQRTRQTAEIVKEELVKVYKYAILLVCTYISSLPFPLHFPPLI